MNKFKIAIIGAGNMGEIIIKGLINGLKLSPKNIVVSDKKTKRLSTLAKKYHLITTVNNLKAISAVKIIILAIKPQDFKAVARELKGRVKPDQVVISIMAGVDNSNLKRYLRVKKVVRAMPNLPAKVGKGMTVWRADGLSFQERKLAQLIFQSLGCELEVKSEKAVDWATAVSGSGPAYVFYFVESLIKAAKSLGFNSKQAELLIEETVKGSAQLLGQVEAEKLRLAVTSKGGITAAAMKVLEQRQVSKAFELAIRAAYKRAQQLKEQ